MSKSKRKIKPPLPVLPSDVWAIDSHCHLDMADYTDDCGAVMQRAAQAGVRKIMTIGTDINSSVAALGLARQYPALACSVGIHPHEAAGFAEACEQLAELARHREVRAIGEIGLDYAGNDIAKDAQQQLFRRQLQLAKDLRLPVIIHDREAHGDVMAILRELAPFPAGGVMHCFSGDSRLAREVIALGFYISISGVVTFNKAQMLQDTVRVTPLDSLLLETDGPFLTPTPYRGRRNEPAYVLYTAQKVADLKGLSLAETVRRTTENTMKLFGLEPI
jgi:TatD DNase family protein